jgi:hypothetical protein
MKEHKPAIQPQTAGRLAYICNILFKAIQGSELEKRIEALEKGYQR